MLLKYSENYITYLVWLVIFYPKETKWESSMRKRYEPRYNTNKEWESPLNELRVKKGYLLNELAEMAQTTASMITGLSSGIISPFGKNGQIRPCVYLLSEILEASFGELFPRYICEISRATNDDVSYAADVKEFWTADDNRRNTRDPESIVADKEAAQWAMGLTVLKEKQRWIIEKVILDEYTFADVASILQLSHNRVAQIFHDSVAKIRRAFRLQLVNSKYDLGLNAIVTCPYCGRTELRVERETDFYNPYCSYDCGRLHAKERQMAWRDPIRYTQKMMSSPNSDNWRYNLRLNKLRQEEYKKDRQVYDARFKNPLTKTYNNKRRIPQ